jgi:hypothetical protein
MAVTQNPNETLKIKKTHKKGEKTNTRNKPKKGSASASCFFPDKNLSEDTVSRTTERCLSK